MPDQLQLRGGTTTEHNSFTGAAREVTVDTTKKTLVVHDGAQAGGTPLMKEAGSSDASSVSIGTGGVERFKITSSEVVFNETSTDTDFRIEGNGDANLFKVDAGNDRIGIGAGTPTNMLNVHGVYETNAFDSANGQGGRFTAKGFLIGDAYTAGKTTSDDRNTILWNERGLNIDFATDDTVRMTIKHDGNIGVGVDSPQHLIHAKNSSVSTTKIVVESTGTDSYPAFRVINDARAYDLGIDGLTDAFRIYDVTAPKERLRITTDGHVKINDGDLQIGTSGHGIDFSVTGNSAGSMSSELFADYEKGSWTPVFTDDGASGNSASSYGRQLGWYCRTGDLVNIQIRISNAVFSGFNTSHATYIKGLPFPIQNDTGRLVTGTLMLSNVNLDSETMSLGVLANVGGGVSNSFFRLFQSKDNAVWTSIPISTFTSGANEILVNFSYLTDG